MIGLTRQCRGSTALASQIWSSPIVIRLATDRGMARRGVRPYPRRIMVGADRKFARQRCCGRHRPKSGQQSTVVQSEVASSWTPIGCRSNFDRCRGRRAYWSHGEGAEKSSRARVAYVESSSVIYIWDYYTERHFIRDLCCPPTYARCRRPFSHVQSLSAAQSAAIRPELDRGLAGVRFWSDHSQILANLEPESSLFSTTIATVIAAGIASNSDRIASNPTRIRSNRGRQWSVHLRQWFRPNPIGIWSISGRDLVDVDPLRFIDSSDYSS